MAVRLVTSDWKLCLRIGTSIARTTVLDFRKSSGKIQAERLSLVLSQGHHCQMQWRDWHEFAALDRQRVVGFGEVIASRHGVARRTSVLCLPNVRHLCDASRSARYRAERKSEPR